MAKFKKFNYRKSNWRNVFYAVIKAFVPVKKMSLTKSSGQSPITYFIFFLR